VQGPGHPSEFPRLTERLALVFDNLSSYDVTQPTLIHMMGIYGRLNRHIAMRSEQVAISRLRHYVDPVRYPTAEPLLQLPIFNIRINNAFSREKVSQILAELRRLEANYMQEY